MTRILLCILLALLPVAGAHAVEVDVYTGQATVADQSAAERRAALPVALDHVLRKLSGARTLDDYPEAAAALRSASSILVTSYYRNVDLPAADVDRVKSQIEEDLGLEVAAHRPGVKREVVRLQRGRDRDLRRVPPRTHQGDRARRDSAPCHTIRGP